MIPLIDLNKQYATIKDDIDRAISRVLQETNFILGPDVKVFEAEMANYLGVKYAVGVASGTDALEIALLSLGLGDGDEVITTPFTFIATAEAIKKAGAQPVFVDIDPLTFCLDPELIESQITPRTKAILPVHLYGHPAEMARIVEIAKKHGLKVIEDCAQSLGAEYLGKRVGSLGDAGCLSFFPGKNLGCYGDGGMFVTDDAAAFERAKMLRQHGSNKKYYHAVSGFNSRLDTIQAAVLNVKLKHLDDWNGMRRNNAALYAGELAGIRGVSVPFVSPRVKHSFNYYTIRTPERAALQERLTRAGIGNMIYYPLSLHLQAVYADLGYKHGDFPVAEKAQEEVLSLPMYAELDKAQIKEIASVLTA
jgi:dTDP-4-amino-4,6-dideoxygalactose transaminase